jgi:hypothetical protein
VALERGGAVVQADPLVIQQCRLARAPLAAHHTEHLRGGAGLGAAITAAPQVSPARSARG